MIGQRLGPYEITAKLGEGGMGGLNTYSIAADGRILAVQTRGTLKSARTLYLDLGFARRLAERPAGGR